MWHCGRRQGGAAISGPSFPFSSTLRHFLIFPVRHIRLLLLPLALSFVSASAHETWLAPASFAPEPGTQVTFSLTSGMKFPALEHAIRPERIRIARFRQGTLETDLGSSSSARSALQFQAAFPAAGFVAAWVTLEPRTLELTDAKVREYFAEINASPEIRDHWAQRKGRRKWKETYTKHAKTFLRVGDAPPDASWEKPVGLLLEFVPLQNPVTLKVGEHAGFLLLENGNPLRNCAVGLLFEGNPKRQFQTTDAEGRVTFELARPGQALFYAVQLRANGEEWQSDFTTLTLSVGK